MPFIVCVLCDRRFHYANTIGDSAAVNCTVCGGTCLEVAEDNAASSPAPPHGEEAGAASSLAPPEGNSWPLGPRLLEAHSRGVGVRLLCLISGHPQTVIMAATSATSFDLHVE